jgi:hypothetical protein
MKWKRKIYILLILLLGFVFTAKDAPSITPASADIPPGDGGGNASHDSTACACDCASG